MSAADYPIPDPLTAPLPLDVFGEPMRRPLPRPAPPPPRGGPVRIDDVLRGVIAGLVLTVDREIEEAQAAQRGHLGARRTSDLRRVRAWLRDHPVRDDVDLDGDISDEDLEAIGEQFPEVRSASPRWTDVYIADVEVEVRR